MSEHVNRPIDPMRIAQKMQRIRNFESIALFEEFRDEPRLIEVLWALQFFSQPARQKPGNQERFVGGYPGGLCAFTFDLINDSLDLIGTRQMRLLGAIRYDRAMASAVYNEIPDRECTLGESSGEAWAFKAVLGDGKYRGGGAPMADFIDESRRHRRQATDREIKSVVGRANRETFLELCIQAARESLANYLRSLCEVTHVRFHRDPDAGYQTDLQAPWYFVDIASALLRFIDRRKEAVRQQIADTEISRDVGKWLGRAQATRRGVMISGNSRFGKTESVEAFCEANPGRARLVETPSSNSESDLLRAVAKAVGMEISPRRLAYQLREEIGYLIEQAGLMLVFDEAQAIFPSAFGRNTAPTRLNWIRRNVLDRGIPAAFVCTPQSYENARKKFLTATNFAIEQWDERLLKIVRLPEEVAQEDLIAIARIRFPSLDSDYLKYVVNAVKLTERNYVNDISRIADLALLNAQESGRTVPNFADIKTAIADALPAPKSIPAAPDRGTPSVPSLRQVRPRKATAGVIHAHRSRKSHAPLARRSSKPAKALIEA